MRHMLAGLVSVLALGCGPDEVVGPPPPTAAPTAIQLPIRVHVVTSRISQFSATFSDQEVTALFARVNEVWAAGGIRWQIESIVHEPLGQEDALEAALAGDIPFTTGLLADALPTAGLSGSWDVFLVRDLGATGVPGVYFPSIPMVVSSEVDPSGLFDPGRILAHELGHSLSLPHVPCTASGNLMSPGCAGVDRIRLSDSQISQARSQAETLRPSS